MRFDALPYTIIATDVEQSSGRDDVLLLAMRRDLRRILGDTLRRQGLDMDALPVLDDGDGFRILLPPQVGPQAALEPFIWRLGVELRNHRLASSAAHRIRLRVAVHSGLLHPEPGGTFTGVPLKDCAQLLDAPAGRELLAGEPAANLVLLVTESFFDLAVRGGSTLDPDLFEKIPVKVKRTDTTARAYLPREPGRANAEPAASKPAASKPAAGAPGPTSSVVIRGDGHTFHGPIYGGGNAR